MSPDALRATLHANELTGRHCARLLGVAPRTVRSWLAGEREVPACAVLLLMALYELRGFRSWLERASDDLAAIRPRD